jgi:tRNA(Ile)-lysidine synthase
MCATLVPVHPAIRKRAFAMALEERGISYDAAHLEAIEELVRRPDDGEVGVDLPGARVIRSYDTLMVLTGEELRAPAPAKHGTMRASAAPGRSRSIEQAASRDRGEAAAELVAPPGYELRVWRPGDRMKPARLKGRSRKLSDLYIDAKVPRAMRRTARVLVRSTDQVIVWAEHLGPAFGEPEGLVPQPRANAGSF